MIIFLNQLDRTGPKRADELLGESPLESADLSGERLIQLELPNRNPMAVRDNKSLLRTARGDSGGDVDPATGTREVWRADAGRRVCIYMREKKYAALAQIDL